MKHTSKHLQSKCKIKSPNLITQKITPNKIPNNNNPCFYSSLLGQTTTHRLTTTIKPRHHNQNVVQRQFHTSSPVKTNSAKAPTEPPTFYESAEEIKKRFHIHDREDWYDVPLQVLRGTPARHLTKEFSSTYDFVTKVFPEHEWDRKQFFTGQIRQKFMERVVKTMFPKEKIERNDKTLGLVSELGNPLEIDCYLPEFKLGFEYQEQHHYFASTYAKTMSLEQIQMRDKIKSEQAAEKGITLIRVPFWWDFQPDSLASTIILQKPDLAGKLQKYLKSAAKPIPTDIPAHLSQLFSHDIPDLGVVMTPTPIESIRASKFDPLNWWVFEKYDGIRAVWHPAKKTFYSRHGKPLLLPSNVEKEFRDINDPLDGEFWFGYGNLSEAMKISMRVPFAKINWNLFKYMVFDLIDRKSPFEKRYAYLSSKFSGDTHKYILLAKYVVCTSLNHLRGIYNTVVSKHGEGIIIREPSALYTAGISKEMYKIRNIRNEKAMLFKKVADRSWICLVPNKGAVQELNMLVDEDCVLDPNTLKEGDIVAYKYYLQTDIDNGRLINPKIYKRMEELTWDEIANQKRVVLSTNRRIFYHTQPHLFVDPAFRRRFFEEYAIENDFDPLVPENWYEVTTHDIESKTGGSTVLKHHNDSLIRALITLFPDVNFDLLRFNRVPINFWHDKDNRRLFMDVFARSRNFSPSSAKDWYNVTRQEILNHGGTAVIRYHKNSHRQALIDLYPAITFNFNESSTTKENQFWTHEANRRAFFENYAKSNNFDALNPDNWYNVMWQDIVDAGGSSALRYHRGALSKALVDLFPDVTFDNAMLLKRKRKAKEAAK